MAEIIQFPLKETEKGRRTLLGDGFADIDFDEFPSPERSSEEGALHAAQELIYDAWEAGAPEESLALAREALELSPHCVDAYNIFASYAETYGEALALYRHAAKIGEKNLGKEVFHDGKGDFWGLLETRPYMRARAGIVECLHAFGDTKNVIKHGKELLKLCTNDNLGIRYILLPLLIETGKDRQAESLYKRYKDDCSAAWRYARALLDFRKNGAGAAADSSLQAAFFSNRFVPDYLLQKKKIPLCKPSGYSFGNKDEAVLLAKDHLAAWQASVGAIPWLDASREL